MKIRKILCLVAVGAAFFASLAETLAQETGEQGATSSGPIMLSPRRLAPAQPAAPADSAPLSGQVTGRQSDTPRPSAPAVQPGPLPSDPSVQVDSLGAVDPDTVGTLRPDEGGFGLDMWRGTSRALVDKLLPALPADSSSAAMRSLARRLLLSSARPPAGEGKSGSLLQVRAELLAEMGDLDSLEALLNVIPSRVRTPELARIEANMRFLANDNARACALAAGQIGRDDRPFWEKAFVFCQALAGQHEKAALGVSLLRETGVDDKVFFDLVDALAGENAAAVGSLPDPTPLLLAMARAANVQLPADVIARNRPMILRAVATSPNAPVALRLEAGERAESMGALPAQTLRELYAAINFSKEELENPLSRAEAESGPLSRALLYRTSIAQTIPVAQAEAVAKALALGREGGRYVSTARVFLPVLNNIPPSAELLWFAPEAVRALLAAGETGQAASWYGVLRASALFNPESEAAVTVLWPVLHLAGIGEAADWQTGYLADWWTAVKDGTGGRANAALMFSLFDAFGEDVPDGLWEDLLDGSQRVTVAAPQPAVWFKLRAASEDGRIGETVLLGLLALGGTEPDQVSPVDLYTVLQRFRAAGLEAEARQLAVEAALAAGA